MPIRVEKRVGLLNEAQIKSIILSTTDIRKNKATIASEYAVGKNTRRADLVVMTHELLGFEIKSDFDTLYRLDAQISEYRKYFDRVIVVATSKHIAKISAMPRTDFDIWSVSAEGKIYEVRRQKYCQPLAATNLIRLLTKQEVERYLKISGRAELNDVSYANAKQAVEAAFLERHRASSNTFWKIVGRGKVRPEHLDALSLYLPRRQRALSRTRAAHVFWQDWHRSADQFFASRKEQANETKIAIEP